MLFKYWTCVGRIADSARISNSPHTRAGWRHQLRGFGISSRAGTRRNSTIRSRKVLLETFTCSPLCSKLPPYPPTPNLRTRARGQRRGPAPPRSRDFDPLHLVRPLSVPRMLLGASSCVGELLSLAISSNSPHTPCSGPGSRGVYGRHARTVKAVLPCSHTIPGLISGSGTLPQIGRVFWLQCGSCRLTC